VDQRYLKYMLLTALIILIAIPATAAPIGIDGTYKMGLNKEKIAEEFIKFRSQSKINRSILPQRPNRDILGDQKNFFAYDFTTGKYYTTQATLRKVSGHCYVYVENSQFNVNVSTGNVDTIGNTFDSIIYPTATSYFGSEWNPGIDNDEKITILVLDIKDGWPSSNTFFQGYFSFLDELPDISAQQPPHRARSNEREMFYMDCFPAYAAGDKFLETLAHEFQHMIHWHQNPSEEEWLDEGMSDLSSYLCGFGLQEDHYTAFYNKPTTKLKPFDGSLESYGVAFTFVLYFFEQYGGTTDITKKNLIKKLTSSGDKGEGSIQVALEFAGYGGVTFDQLYKDFCTMLALDSTGVAKYSISQADIVVDPLFKHYGYPVRDRSWDVDYWSRQYVMFEEGGSAESKVLKFMGSGSTGFAVRMVLFNKDSSITVDDVKLNSVNDGFYDLWALGKTYTKALMIVMFPHESGTTSFRYNVGYAGPKAGIYPNPIFPDDIQFSVNSFIPPQVWVKRSGGTDTKITMKYLEKGFYTGYHHVDYAGDYNVTIYGEDEEGLAGTIYTSFSIQKLYRYVLNMIAFNSESTNINMAIARDSNTEGSVFIKKPGDDLKDRIEKTGLKYLSGIDMTFTGTGNLTNSKIVFTPETIPEKAGVVIDNGTDFRWISSVKDNKTIEADFEVFKAHALVVDNVPPIINEAINDGITLSIRTQDIGSGISLKNSVIRINGEEVEFRLTADGQLKTNIIGKTINSLAVKLSDNAGNTIERMVQINRATLKNRFSAVYPNPALTHAIVDLSAGSGSYKLKIYDQAMRTVFKKDVIGTTYRWDLKNSMGTDVSNGTYHIEIKDVNQDNREKLKISVLR